MDIREINRAITGIGRGVRTGRRVFDDVGRAIQVDPRRRDRDESGNIRGDQRNWRGAEEEAYRREMLDRRAREEGLDPRTERGFRQGGRGGFGASQLPPGTIIGEDGSAWRTNQPGWLARNLFGAEPEMEQIAPPGTFAPGRAPGQQTPFGEHRPPQGRGQFPEAPPRGFAAPAPGPVGREDLPPVAGRQQGVRVGQAEGQNVLEAFGRLNGQQQQDVVGALQRSGAMRGDPRDPQALAAGLSAGLRQNFPNINPATANPSELLNPLVDMPGQIAARARDQQAQGRGGRPGAAPAPQAGGAPTRPAAPAAPQMERGEHVAEFQRRAMAMNPENNQRLVQGLRPGSRPDDGIAGNNTEAVRREVITRLNADRGNNPEIPANTNLRDLNRIMEQRGIRLGQAPGTPEPLAAEASPPEPQPTAPNPTVAALQEGFDRRADFNRFRDEAQRVIDQNAADRGPIARAPMISDPEGLASLEQARAALAQAGAGGLVDPDGQPRPATSPIRIGGNDIAPGFGG